MVTNTMAAMEVVETGEKRDRRGRRITPVHRRDELVSAWLRSGMTQAAFARHEGVNDTTFCSWVQQLGGESGSKPGGRVPFTERAPCHAAGRPFACGMPTSPRILAFSGSARRESLNRKLLAVVVDAVRAVGGEVTLVDLNDFVMPLYHGDLEDAEGLPANAQKLIDLILSHDALLVASPEYNSQLTPLLKNTIDWCTRADDNPFRGKVASVVSASPGMFGGVRSMTLLRQLLTHLGCHVIPAQCVLPHADKAFDATGRLQDARTQKAVVAVATELVHVSAKLSAS